MWFELAQIKQSIRFPACFIAFGFGIGLLRIIPGTLSTLLVGIPLHHLLSTLPKLYYNIVLFLFIMLGVVVCSIAEEVLGTQDDPIIVWDEICGYLLTMSYAHSSFTWTILGFLLFRFFDIFKPWPINIVQEKVEGGLGIMLDDVIAGIYAGLVLHLFFYIL